MKVFLLVLALIGSVYGQCRQTPTTCSGSKAPKEICGGDLIFEDNFDHFDLEKWQHELTLAGAGNWEFQWYTNNRSNSWTKDGNLYICPTLTSDVMGEPALTSATLNIHGGTPADTCTDAGSWGCERTGFRNNVLNPIRSARLRTVNSFSFRYGLVEVRARLPAGDWIWPAIWLMPKSHAYGTWPASGEIDLMESRGNRNLMSGSQHIGTQYVGQTLHFGPSPDLNSWEYAHTDRNFAGGYDTGFHLFQMEWTPDALIFYVDNVETGRYSGPFWDLGRIQSRAPWATNPWVNTAHTPKMAPFDQEFYFIMNVAVGGVAYFPDDAQNPDKKPWKNNSPQASTDFWDGRNKWLPTWNMGNNYDRSMVVDYVRVWAL